MPAYPEWLWSCITNNRDLYIRANSLPKYEYKFSMVFHPLRTKPIGQAEKIQGRIAPDWTIY